MKSTTETHQRGIQWTFQKHLEDLDFADDIALLSHRSIDLEAKTSALDQQGNKNKPWKNEDYADECYKSIQIQNQ